MSVSCKGFKPVLWALALLAAVTAMNPGALAASQTAFGGPVPVMGEPSRTPLMIIRFNQRHVYFERSLYNVVSKALEVKSSVMFDLVSMVPGSERGAAAAEGNLGKVVSALSEMGVPRSRLSISRQDAPNLEASEVHLFVR